MDKRDGEDLVAVEEASYRTAVAKIDEGEALALDGLRERSVEESAVHTVDGEQKRNRDVDTVHAASGSVLVECAVSRN